MTRGPLGSTVLLALLVLVAGCASAPVSDGAGGAGDADDPGDSSGDGSTADTLVPGDGPTVTVTRVVDGDTMEVEYPNGTADTVRLIGVDTPEVHAENTPGEFEGVPETAAGRTCLRTWGEKASSLAKERLTGAQVTLQFDPNLDRRGYYSRLLVYVVVDGQSFNEQLVAEGYARVYDSEFSRQDRFYGAEATAQREGTGLWGACATENPSTATPTGTATGTAVTDGGVDVRVVEIHADAEGNDNDNLNDEYVVLANRGDEAVDLSGWTVADEAGHTYTFPDGATLEAGARITLHTGTGEDTSTDRYWGRSGAVWNNGGDVVVVRDAAGDLVAREEY